MKLSVCARVVSLFLLFFLALGQAAYSMEWHEAYSKGQKAIDKGKCSEGVPLIQQALQEKPKSDLRARPYGTFTFEYIPYFYLAKCAVDGGDYETAQKYMKAAEAGSIYASSKATEFDEIKTKFQAMKKPVKPPTTVPGTTTPTNNETNPPEKQVLPPPPPPQEKQVEVPKKDTSAEMIQRYLGEANASLRSGNLSGAKDAVNRALILDSNNAEARSLLASITQRERAEGDQQDLQKKIDSVRGAIRSGDLASAESQVAALKAQYPSNNSINSLSQEIQNKKQQQQAKDQQEQAKDQQAEMNRMMEKQVLSAYYSGQYPAVIQMAEKNLKENPNSWKLHFYLGCAYTALSMLESEDKEDRLQRARESFRKAKSIAANMSLPPLISPKIVEVFRNS